MIPLITQNTMLEPPWFVVEPWDFNHGRWFDNHSFREITFIVSFAVKIAIKPMMVPWSNHGRFYRDF